MSYVKELPRRLPEVYEVLRNASTRVRVNVIMHSPYEVFRKYDEGEFYVPPEIKREYVWDKVTASRFIESLVFGLPIPPIMVIKAGVKYWVVDGFQRLETLRRFFRNELSLTGVSSELERKTWKSLLDRASKGDKTFELHVVRLQTERTIPVFELEITVPGTSDAETERNRRLIMYELFRRINLGAKRLTPGQVLFCTLSDTELIKTVRNVATGDPVRSLFKWTKTEEKRFAHYLTTLSLFLTELRHKPSPLSVIRRLYTDTIDYSVKLSPEEVSKLSRKVLDTVLLMREFGLERRHFTKWYYSQVLSKKIEAKQEITQKELEKAERRFVNQVISTVIYDVFSTASEDFKLTIDRARKLSHSAKEEVVKTLEESIYRMIVREIVDRRVTSDDKIEDSTAEVYDRVAKVLKKYVK